MSQEKPDVLQQCANVLQSELTFTWIFSGLAVVAFVVAILLLQLRGSIALTKLENAANAIEDDPEARKRFLGADFKSFAEGLKALAEALRNAPAGVTLFIVAIGVFYIPAANVGEPCNQILQARGDAQVAERRLSDTLTALSSEKSCTVKTVKEGTKTATTLSCNK